MEKDNLLPKILNFTIDILKPYMLTGVKFVGDRVTQSEISYTLMGDAQPNSREDAKGNSVPVVRMSNGYWLGCSFSYFRRKHNKKELKQMCLHFFDEKSPLFRADWACSEIAESKNHAQPHWHFDTETTITKVKQAGFSIPQYTDYPKVVAKEKVDTTADLGRVHFFMNWDIEKDTSVSAPYLDFRDDRTLKNWLTKAFEYIDAELKSIVNRRNG